ncbi:MAG TPA: acyl-CoA dehydratase activase [Candidatus Hydrogenedentes bacterium]|nr:acyl-CoA dehydratase activase [Candidatus Hydrogenedentota bacterium]
MSGVLLFAGVDVGSATTKAVLVDVKGRVVAHTVIPSGGKLAAAATVVLERVLGEARVTMENVAALVSTGYGRESVSGRTKAVTEITCHARGAHTLNPAVRSVIDIGGQDSKAIALDERGGVRRFEMNDKCAAGTGRFLEVMARTLQVGLDEIGPLALSAESPARISSTCTVFAESEVISLLAQDESIPSILAGLCTAIAQRVNSLAARVGMMPEVMMTGGVAKNVGVVRGLEQAVGLPLITPEEPQIVGALGAALIARDLGARRQDATA